MFLDTCALIFWSIGIKAESPYNLEQKEGEIRPLTSAQVYKMLRIFHFVIWDFWAFPPEYHELLHPSPSTHPHPACLLYPSRELIMSCHELDFLNREKTSSLCLLCLKDIIAICFANYSKGISPTILIALAIGKIRHCFKASMAQMQNENNTNIYYRTYYRCASALAIGCVLEVRTHWIE